ncbi:hypothetical protein [Halobacterium yunchengense]|uniref:hypothetical protein n=1 Tax=Halobacterium yunchengense TaxID=3108497 RepID=UPI00300AB1BE
MTDRASGPAVGIVCNRDHDVFADVAGRLRCRGAAVEFFEPGVEVSERAVGCLDLLANKKADPASLRALRRARDRGVATWNGPLALLLAARFVGYRALAAAGFRVPASSAAPPAGDYVAKTAVDWHFEPDPELNGTGDVYQPLLPTDGVDRKYYAVDTGDRVRVSVVRATSKLRGEKERLETVRPDPGLAAATRRLVRLVGAQALGVDVVYSGGEPYAVDVNPAMSFRGTGMAPELAASMLARLPERTADAVSPPAASR